MIFFFFIMVNYHTSLVCTPLMNQFRQNKQRRSTIYNLLIEIL